MSSGQGDAKLFARVSQPFLPHLLLVFFLRASLPFANVHHLLLCFNSVSKTIMSHNGNPPRRPKSLDPLLAREVHNAPPGTPEHDPDRTVIGYRPNVNAFTAGSTFEKETSSKLVPNDAEQGKVAELRQELNSGGKKDKNHSAKKIALKKIVANMTMSNNDMVGLFPDIIACMQTPSLEIKKM